MWRLFDTIGQAEAYCRQCYVTMVRNHARTLTRQEMDDHWNLPTRARIPDLPDSHLVGSRFPIYGRCNGRWNSTSGYTTGWATPRETADNRWSVEAFDHNDPDATGTQPEWPVA